MPEHVFTLAARGHAVDAQTNTLTIFSVVEEIGAPGLPVGIPQLSVITLWRRQKGEEGVAFVQRTRLVDPTGSEVFHFDQEFRLEKARHRSLGTVEMLPLEKPGAYNIEVQIRKADDATFSTVATYRLDVSVTAKANEPLLKDS
ncbi:MAG: hypothetical protein IMZ55_16310 [Acidobacteria bacterium]|nr:hypothetical protein [Planctomycetota bacterium]MBE3135031.1 hypothetical protein [Acidobacteriota bacterium]